jgi:hypothetical protein
MLPSGNRFAPAVNEGHFRKVFRFRWPHGKSQKFYGGTMALLGKPMSFPAGPWSHRKNLGFPFWPAEMENIAEMTFMIA